MGFRLGESANRLRGGMGKALMEEFPAGYERLFAPRASGGPSGLRDRPRPFVLRVAHLEGARIGRGERFEIGLNVFADARAAIELAGALRTSVDADAAAIEGGRMAVHLAPYDRPVRGVRVRFLTPTELKGASQPAFGVLFGRIRDRVSALRAVYGGGPLPIDFRGMGERAGRVRMTKCELRHVEAERISRSTGQRHALGGFIGVADYEGELAEFAPYLEAARFTGVGRQTVWGKGEIGWEEI
ncbi:MAG TPA: CRISPR system precrRNA processing endoribonuclease RAMP protein Cas6 [Bryobacteraceae bacterium]|nr:CRISPR system precrRNA processing endoribonuclease RAMP protein Cas6 [Bryobacteraceae bacterium]